MGDVFFAEACIVDRLCRNGEGIFDLKAGEMFECDLDRDAYHEMADLFQKRVPIKEGCVNWHDSSWA